MIPGVSPLFRALLRQSPVGVARPCRHGRSEHALEPLMFFPASARMSHGLLAHTRTHRTAAPPQFGHRRHVCLTVHTLSPVDSVSSENSAQRHFKNNWTPICTRIATQPSGSDLCRATHRRGFDPPRAIKPNLLGIPPRGSGPTCHRPQRPHQRTLAPRQRQLGLWPTG